MRSIWSIQKPAISVIKFKSILQYQFFIYFIIYFRKYKILIDIFFPIRIKKNVRDTLKNIFQIIRTKHHLFLELATKHHFPKSHNHQRMNMLYSETMSSGALRNWRYKRSIAFIGNLLLESWNHSVLYKVQLLLNYWILFYWIVISTSLCVFIDRLEVKR